MDTSTVNIKYRPFKIGFIVRKGNTDDFLKAVGINTMIWGGMYNPIIPFENEQYTKEIGDDFAVDYYYQVSDDVAITHFIDKYPEHKVSFHSNDIFTKYDKKFAVIDVANFYNEPHRDEFMDVIPYYLKWDKKEFSLLQKVLFGFYPERNDLDVNFEKEFLKYFKIDPLQIKSNTSDVNEFHDKFTPIELTRAGLGMYTSLRKNSDLINAGRGIYIGSATNFDDLSYYWNLRAYGYELQFSPIGKSTFFDKNIGTFISKHDSIPADEEVWPSSLSIFYRDCNKGKIAKITGLIKGDSIHHQLNNSSLGILRYDRPASFYHINNGHSLAQVNMISNNYQLSFNLVNFPFKNIKRDTSRQRFIASIDLDKEPFYKSTLNVPNIPELNNFYRIKAIGRYKIDELKSENMGLGLIITNQVKNLTLHAISFRDIIYEMLSYAGLKPEVSQAGILTNQIINKLGHIDGCRLFKISGVRKLFKSLKVDDAITLSRIRELIFDGGSFSKFENLYIEKRESQKLSTTQVTEYILKHDFFKAGLVLKCNNCYLENWLPVKRLDDYWNCEYCGNTNQLSIALKNRGDWKFRKSGLFGKENNQEGAIPVILALLILYTCLQTLSYLQSFIFETAIKLKAPDDCEVDFVAVNCKNRDDFEVGFGECKDVGGSINQQDIDNLKRVYNHLKEKRYKPYIFFVKAANEFLPEELELFRSLQQEKYRLILFTNNELESHYMHSSPEIKIPRPHPQSFSDMAWNSSELYLKEPEVPFDLKLSKSGEITIFETLISDPSILKNQGKL